MPTTVLKTPFYKQHLCAGAKIVTFAGVALPLQYDLGIIKEHEWVRTRAGLFDVSHMGQCFLQGKNAAQTLNLLTPSFFTDLPVGCAKYTVLTNPKGGIIDDLIITKLAEDTFYMVLNAARAAHDLSWIEQNLQGDTTLTTRPPCSPLIALQGPHAHAVLTDVFNPGNSVRNLGFMQGMQTTLMGTKVIITRTGYTGEDGFELAIQSDEPEKAQHIWAVLCQHENVKPVGLGARDSLRLEVGFPLYGQDLTEDTSPVEANLGWLISKKNKTFFGHKRILPELENGPERKRIGIIITEKGVAREGSLLYSPDGQEIGILTSGGFSPSTKQSIGQGYIKAAHTVPDKIILAQVRNRRLRARTHRLNFINPRTLKPGA